MWSGTGRRGSTRRRRWRCGREREANGQWPSGSSGCDGDARNPAYAKRTIFLPSGKRADLARRYGIRSIRVFGSRARGDERADSDVDLLIEAEKPYRFDLLGLISLEQELSAELGISVDLVLDEDLKPVIGERVRSEAVPV